MKIHRQFGQLLLNTVKMFGKDLSCYLSNQRHTTYYVLKPSSKCVTFQQWLSYVNSLLNSQYSRVEFIHFTHRDLKGLHRNFNYIDNTKVTVLIAVPGSSLCAEATRHKPGWSISPRNSVLPLDDSYTPMNVLLAW